MQSKLRNRVRERRLAYGMSQRRLSEVSKVSRQTVFLIERDDGYEPTASVMGRISDALEDPALFWREEIAS